MIKYNFVDGTLGYVRFGKTIGSEINDIHLAVLFKVKGVNNMIFCIPLTSPKQKHFKSIDDFKKRNYLGVKYLRLHYIIQTNSIALLKQIRMISNKRIINYYKDENNKIVILNSKELNLLKNIVIKYIKYIFDKKSINVFN